MNTRTTAALTALAALLTTLLTLSTLAAPAPKPVTVVRVTLLAGETPPDVPAPSRTTFSTTDTAISCDVALSRRAPGTKLRAVWTAVEGADGVKNVKMSDDEHVMKTGDVYTFTHIFDDGWPAGSFKIDLFLNGKPIRTLPFTVK